MALPLKREVSTDADQIKSTLVKAWSRSDAIFNLVGTDQMLDQPIVWRHPFIFYVGHLPAFAWNQICGRLLEWTSFSPYLDELFCRGIDPDVDTGECHWHPEVPDHWPRDSVTMFYRDRVRGALLGAVDVLCDRRAPRSPHDSGRALQLVLEHEYMHQETLLYMMLQMEPGKKQHLRQLPEYEFYSAAKSKSIRIPTGPARVGARRDDWVFGWDNEFEEI